MSIFTTAIPSPAWDFERDQYFSLEYPSYAGDADMTSLPFKAFNHVPNHRVQGWSRNSATSSPSQGRSTSAGRSSNATSRSPPMRMRTPIRNHASSTPQIQHNIPPAALLPLATQEDSPLAMPQDLVSSPGSFPSTDCLMGTTTSCYPSATCYDPSVGIPHQRLDAPYMTSADFPYSLESNNSGYYPSGLPTFCDVESLSSILEPSDPSLPSRAESSVAPPPWSPPTSAPRAPKPTLSSSSTPFSDSRASSTGNGEGIRVLASRPKPQCFDHGCNGREFSTFSNLLRHQREKSGSASKYVCPYCGTEFTRTTARKGHVEGGKCKAMDGRRKG